MDAFKLNIAEPCHANWQNMTDTEKGRFCSSCKKEVIDFTLMNNNEVYKTMLKGENDICGRFFDSQLNTEIELKKEKKQYWHKYFFSLFIPTFLFSKQGVAQKGMVGKVACVRPVNTMTTGAVAVVKSTDIKNVQPITLDKLSGKVDHYFKIGEAFVSVAEKAKKDFELSGAVFDIITLQKVDASIIIKNSGYGISTDSNGHFKLTSNVTDNVLSLIISAIGYETKEMSIAIPVNGFKMSDMVFLLKRKVEQLDTLVISSYIDFKQSTVAGGMSMKVCVKRYSATDTVRRIMTKLSDSLKVYPNPVRRGNMMNIELKIKPQENYVLQIIEASGKVIFQKQIISISKIHSEQLLTDSRWSNGTYFIRIIDAENKLISTSRFVVE